MIDHKLYINAKKSEFILQDDSYLGHIISKEGIKTNPQKLKVIKEWPILKNLHDLRNFLGMCSCYRRFIEKFSLLSGPLHDLTKKKVKYQWTPQQQEAFDTFKEKLMS